MASYLEEAIVVHTLKQSTITALLGQRFYFPKAPQRARRPFGVLNQVTPSNESETLTFGRMGQPLLQVTFTEIANKATPDDAFKAAHAFMDIWMNLQGTIESVVFKYVFCAGPRSIPASNDEDVEYIVEMVPHYEEP